MYGRNAFRDVAHVYELANMWMLLNTLLCISVLEISMIYTFLRSKDNFIHIKICEVQNESLVVN
jgi:hypothetical protein